MAYLGNPAVDRFVAPKAVTQFSGNGVLTDFTLDHSVGSDEDILVSVDGVIQEPSVAYSVSGTTLSFTTAPSSNSGNNIFVYYLFRTVGTVSHPSNNALEATSGTFTSEIITSTSGTSNFRAGVNAGNSIASGGNYNVVIGDEAGTALTTGDSNVAVGFEALSTEDTHSRNTAIGHQSLKTQDAGANAQSTAVGYNSGKAVTTGIENVFIGASAGETATTPNYTVAVGKSALGGVLTGEKNTAVGYHAGISMTSGTKNTILGAEAGDGLTDADFNVAIGTNALGNDQKGNRNTAVGHGSLATQQFTSSQDSGNTAVGFGTGNAITDGVQNVFVGIDAGKNATTCNNVVAIGISAGGNSTLTGNNNVLVGNSAGAEITSGVNNICLGQDSGRSGKPGGALITTSNNICLGDSSISGFHCQVGITVASDERDKTDFKDLDLGLDFVKDLKPYTYKWDKRVHYGDSTEKDYDFSTQTPDGTHKEDWLDVGFKAQDVEKLEKEKGYDKDKKTNLLISSVDDGKQYGMRYEKFVPILVKAIQDLSVKNDALETENATQATQIADLISRVTALESK